MAQTEQALFIEGDYRTKKITSTEAGGALTAGDVLVIDDLVCIIHNIYTTDDYTDGKQHAAAIGGGTYSVLKATTSGSAFETTGEKVYWDDDNNVVTATASTHKVMGRIVNEADDDAATVDVHHDPGA